MYVRLSTPDRQAYRFLDTPYLRIRGNAVWSRSEMLLATLHGSSWTWGHSSTTRIDIKGPLALEFRAEMEDTPFETPGPFERLSLQKRTLLHKKRVVAYHDGSLGRWVSTSTARSCLDLYILGAPTKAEVAKRQKMIERAAYFKAEKRGFVAGHDTADWLRAEAEIDAQLWFRRSYRRRGALPDRAGDSTPRS